MSEGYFTLDSLMRDRKPGEIKVIRHDWPEESWFQPYYIGGDRWYGPSRSNRITGNNQNWAMACGLFIAVKNFYCTQAWDRVTCEKCKAITPINE